MTILCLLFSSVASYSEVPNVIKSYYYTLASPQDANVEIEDSSHITMLLGSGEPISLAPDHGAVVLHINASDGSTDSDAESDMSDDSDTNEAAARIIGV